MASAGASYNWALPNGIHSTATNININSITNADTGKYVLTAFVGNCIAKDSVVVSAKPIPQVQFLALTEVCSNVAAFTLSANETTGIAGNGGIFSGVGVSSNGVFNPANIGDGLATVRFTYTANNGCSAFKEQTILVNPAPIISLEDEKYIKAGTPTPLNAIITGNYNVLFWQDATNTLSDKNIANPIAKPFKETIYRITAATNKNCFTTDSITIKMALPLTIPNAFSPNGDGKNDKWIVEDKAKLIFIKANIFDRYGKLVKTFLGNKIEWDGMYNGKPLPIATYYYVLTITTENITENVGGWIQLLR